MKPYHKIQSIFKRDPNTHKFTEGVWSCPEFEYLSENEWVFTEKVDGTNIRIMWENVYQTLQFGGRTNNAQMPTHLLMKLQEMFTKEKFIELYGDVSMCLYGEGYGAKIQKGGGRYIADGCSFILFDVVIADWWLKWENIMDIALKLGVATVPIIAKGTLYDGIELIKTGVKSTFYNDLAEGIVCKPTTELTARNGMRIITKLKHKDFNLPQ